MTKFQRHPKHKKLKDSWRRPRGHQNKLRKGKKSKGKKPNVGYGTQDKGKHPSGYYEKIVHNTKELEDVNEEEEAVRIGGTVGKRKKKEITENAEKMGLKVLNPFKEG